MKPRALLASAVDAAFFAAVCAAFGLAVALAWDAAAHGPHSLLRARTSPPPAVSTRASAFRGAGWGEAAGDSSTPAPHPDNAMNATRIPADLLDAIAAVETNADDAAINFAEDAHGRYQIRAAYLADANRFLGSSYTLADMHDQAKAERVVMAYLRHYGTERGVTSLYDLARIHNGGPKGAEKRSTIDYGARVWEALARIRLEARHA
jgi:hypothetical protein